MKKLFIGQTLEIKDLITGKIISAKITDLSVDLHCDDDHPIWIEINKSLNCLNDFWVDSRGIDVDNVIEIQNGNCEY